MSYFFAVKVLKSLNLFTGLNYILITYFQCGCKRLDGALTKSVHVIWKLYLWHFSEKDACVSDCCDYETLSKSAKIRLKGIKLHDTELREFTSAESLWSPVYSTLLGLSYSRTCGICFEHQLILMIHLCMLQATIFKIQFRSSFIFSVWNKASFLLLQCYTGFCVFLTKTYKQKH